jgi:hypothetical protein
VLNPQVLREFNNATLEEAPDDAVKQFLWFLWRGVAWVGLFTLVGVALMLWFVFYVIIAAWRDPRG